MLSAQTVKNLMRHPGEIGRALVRRIKQVPVLLRIGRTIKNLLHVNRLAMRVENLEHAFAAGGGVSRGNVPEFIQDRAEVEELRIALHRKTRRSREVEMLLREITEATIPIRRMDDTRQKMIGQAIKEVHKNMKEYPLQTAILGRGGSLWMQEGFDLTGVSVQNVEEDEDTLPYLRHCQGQSLDLIMIPHTGERMPLAELTESLVECGRVLRSGGALVWEMVDFVTDQEAYSPLTDPLMVTVLRSETLRLLVKKAGLTRIQQGWTAEWQEPGTAVGRFRDYILIAFRE